MHPLVNRSAFKVDYSESPIAYLLESTPGPQARLADRKHGEATKRALSCCSSLWCSSEQPHRRSTEPETRPRSTEAADVETAETAQGSKLASSSSCEISQARVALAETRMEGPPHNQEVWGAEAPQNQAGRLGGASPPDFMHVRKTPSP